MVKTPIADRLEASLKLDAINGTHNEKHVLTWQIKEAIAAIRNLQRELQIEKELNHAAQASYYDSDRASPIEGYNVFNGGQGD